MRCKLLFFILISLINKLPTFAEDSKTFVRTDTVNNETFESFTDKQKLYIKEIALERSEKSIDRSLDLFSKTIDLMTVGLSIMSVLYIIFSVIGFNELKKVRKFRTDIQLSLRQSKEESDKAIFNIQEDFRQKSAAIFAEIEKDGNSWQSYLDEVARLNHTESLLRNEDYYNAFKEIRRLKASIKNAKNKYLLAIQEAKVLSSGDVYEFYNLRKAKELLDNCLEINKDDIIVLNMLGYIEYSFYKTEKIEKHLEDGITFFKRILEISNEDDDPVLVRQVNINISEGYKTLQNFSTALEYITNAEVIKDNSNISIEEYITQNKGFLNQQLLLINDTPN